MWVSLLGLGVSAAALGLRKNRNRFVPIKNLMNHFQFRNNEQMTKMANAITEFSTELVPFDNEKK